MTITLLENEQEFQEIIANNKFAIIDFFSTECPPCEKLAPIFERLSKHYQMIQFAKIWRQQNRSLAQALDVQGSPTLLFFYQGQIQSKRLSGDINEKDIKELLDQLLLKANLTNQKTVNKSVIEERDLCIVGAGPAGFTASIYAARYKVDHIIVGELTGGLMTSSHKICNYPSETEITGMDLTQKMYDHVLQLGAPHLADTVVGIQKIGDFFEVELSSEKIIKAKTVLMATGTKHKHLGLQNEVELTGRGVSYCATCDAMFYRNKTVAVVGGSDSANTAALYLADIAEKVYQIYRKSELRGETAWIDLIKQNPKIELILNSNITKLNGEKNLESVELDQPYQGSNELKINGLFVEIGSDPELKLIQQLKLKTDEKGYIETQPDQGTSIQGLWAAGDITTNSNQFRQIVTAASEGAIAAESIFKYLRTK